MTEDLEGTKCPMHRQKDQWFFRSGYREKNCKLYLQTQTHRSVQNRKLAADKEALCVRS